ncbi:hypothetical protein C8R41DRAFT_927142 [Lentinula lateritia]|uniref:Uncharacterized protein n=1 Tax=Lentinula lateritia TaxID=40482 RepID=A0ABQ8V2Z9_9AGAR|nr:hypothetical protein C8R41DRAFT_927142 [Lentinula lateritia]
MAFRSRCTTNFCFIRPVGQAIQSAYSIMDPSVQTSYADIQATFGPLLLGGLGAAILTGMIIAQGFNYLKSNTDPSYVRCMVGIIVYGYLTLKFHLTSAYSLPSFLDILHLVTLCLGLWMWFIKMHEATVAIFIVPFAISISVVFTALTTIIAHGFFAWRIFKREQTSNFRQSRKINPPVEVSKKNYWLVIPIAVPAILAFVFACKAEMIRLNSFPQFRRYCPWALTVALALSAGVDVVITIMMMVLLRQSRAKSLRRVIASVASQRQDSNIQMPTFIALQLERRDRFPLRFNARKWSHNIACCDYLHDTRLYFIIDKLYGNSILAVSVIYPSNATSSNLILSTLPGSTIANIYLEHGTMASQQGSGKAAR